MKKTHWPFILIWARLFIALLFPIAAFYFQAPGIALVILMIVGLLTDIFDGIIARQLNVASEKLRVYDSNVDVVFWMAVIISLLGLNNGFLSENGWWIGSVIFLELCCYGYSFIKFKKTIATHTILAKIWTLSLIAFLIDLALNQTSFIAFWICIILGVLSRIEILLIIRFLTSWTTDVPSIVSVFKLNKGKSIKRNKWFN